MTTGEKLVELSTLIQDTALQHLIHIKCESEIYFIKTVYKIRYIGEKSNFIKYIKNNSFKISYIAQNKIIPIRYEQRTNYNVRYIENNKIKVKLRICKQ